MQRSVINYTAATVTNGCPMTCAFKSGLLCCLLFPGRRQFPAVPTQKQHVICRNTLLSISPNSHICFWRGLEHEHSPVHPQTLQSRSSSSQSSSRLSPSICSPHSGPKGTENTWYLWIQFWRDTDKNWHNLGQQRHTNFENIKGCTEVCPVLVPSHPSEQQHPGIVPWKHHLVFNICHGGSHPLG